MDFGKFSWKKTVLAHQTQQFLQRLLWCHTLWEWCEAALIICLFIYDNSFYWMPVFLWFTRTTNTRNNQYEKCKKRNNLLNSIRCAWKWVTWKKISSSEKHISNVGIIKFVKYYYSFRNEVIRKFFISEMRKKMFISKIVLIILLFGFSGTFFTLFFFLNL